MGRKRASVSAALDPRRLPYIPDRRLRTPAAAKRAVRVAEMLQSGNSSARGFEELELFLAMETCAYRAARPERGRRIPMSERRPWAERYRVIRDCIVEQHLGLAYSMIRRFKCHELDHDDLVSDALFALSRAVERFNPWKGFRFSTYACTAIARALINRSKRGLSYRQRFPFRHDVSFELSEKVDTQTELFAERLRRVLKENLGELDEREASVLAQRFPLDHEPQSSLGEIGRAIGLSKERVRQIQNSALRKLREVLAADRVLQ